MIEVKDYPVKKLTPEIFRQLIICESFVDMSSKGLVGEFIYHEETNECPALFYKKVEGGYDLYALESDLIRFNAFNDKPTEAPTEEPTEEPTEPSSGAMDEDSGQSYDSVQAAIDAGAKRVKLFSSVDSLTLPDQAEITIDGNNQEITSDLSVTKAKKVVINNLNFKSQNYGVIGQDQTSLSPNPVEIELHNCNFEGNKVKALYFTNAKKAIIDGCKFTDVAVDDYAIDFNQCAVQDAEITIQNCIFEGEPAKKSSIKVTQRGGENDYAHDIMNGIHKWNGESYEDQEGATPASIKLLTVSGCTFNSAPMADITIGSSPNTDGPEVGPRTSNGNYPCSISGNGVKVLQRWKGEDSVTTLGDETFTNID